LSNNVTLQELLAANNIAETDLLLIGQELVIPGVAAPAPSLTTLSPAATGTLTATRGVTSTTGVTAATGITSTAGVTSTRPATTTLSSLRPAGVAASNTTTGTTGTISAPAGTPAVHTVVVGDTIISIALEYNLDWQDLLDLNGLQPNSLLRIGQEIKLR
jgi:LysM repeat protein